MGVNSALLDRGVYAWLNFGLHVYGLFVADIHSEFPGSVHPIVNTGRTAAHQGYLQGKYRTSSSLSLYLLVSVCQRRLPGKYHASSSQLSLFTLMSFIYWCVFSSLTVVSCGEKWCTVCWLLEHKLFLLDHIFTRYILLWPPGTCARRSSLCFAVDILILFLFFCHLISWVARSIVTKRCHIFDGDRPFWNSHRNSEPLLLTRGPIYKES